MKRKFDFILNKNRFHQDIFRFYPRLSDVHSFNDEPPKSWDEVYKVYYYWAIIRQHFDDNGKIESESSQILFQMYCDECSCIPELSGIIKYVIKTGKTFDYPTFGQPAGDWRISQRKGFSGWNGKEYEYYDFQVFDNWTNQGYRFVLDKMETLKFCDWLDEINQYALEHGIGI